MKEKVDYRVTIEEFNKVYPNKQVLNLSEAERVTGLSRQHIKKCFKEHLITIGNRKYINKCTLARLIS